MKTYIETLLIQGSDELFDHFFTQRAHYIELGMVGGRSAQFEILSKSYSSDDNLIRCQIEISSKEQELILQNAIKSGLMQRLEDSNQDSTRFCLN